MSDEEILTVEVPGRICLFGDKVDLLEKPVIGAAINSLMYTKISKRNDNQVFFYSQDLNFKKSFQLNDPLDINHPMSYWSAVVNRLRNKISGFSAEIRSEIPIGAGLSSSAAFTISLIKSLNLLFDLNMNVDEIAELAYLCEHDDVGIMCGRLDQYSIAYGGVTYIETDNKAKVEKINIEKIPVVVGDSKEERKASSVLNRIKKQIYERDEKVLGAFKIIEDITEKGKNALINHDFEEVGRLMSLQQEQEVILGASTPKLDKMCKVSIEAGAFGGKLMGAGGGGCMVVVCPGKQKQVAKAIESVGGKPWIFEIYNYKKELL